jgi:hypothetical protein
MEGVKVRDLLVIKEGGRCPLPEGKDSLEHRDGVAANVRVKIVAVVKGRVLVITLVLLVTEEIEVIIIIVIRWRR